MHFRYEKFETSSKNGVNSELFIRNVDRRDGALYSCTASNNYGSDERNIKVLVVGMWHLLYLSKMSIFIAENISI